MNYIEHHIDTNEVLLLWRAPELASNRLIVGKLTSENSHISMDYEGGSDLALAKDTYGFQGLPPLSFGKEQNEALLKLVLETRLCSPIRSDYGDYLQSHRLNPEKATSLTLFQHLVHTTGAVKGDDFSFIPVLTACSPPFDYLAEIVGFRHNQGMTSLDSLSMGQEVMLILTPHEEDQFAIVVMTHQENKLGYLFRSLAEQMAPFLSDPSFKVSASIEKINGTKDRPRVYLMLRVRSP